MSFLDFFKEFASEVELKVVKNKRDGTVIVRVIDLKKD